MRQLIRVENEGAVFYLRVAAVVRREGKVLLHQAEGEDFWSLPGGRVEIGESAAISLEREMKEELDVEASAGRLLWVVECFFKYLGKQFHELGLYFEVNLPDGTPLTEESEPFFRDDAGVRLTFHWFAYAELRAHIILPSFLSTSLGHLPETTQHIVQMDGRMDAARQGYRTAN